MRLALGAGRGRLVRQLLTESLCLAIAGGVCGLGVGLRAAAGADPPARRPDRRCRRRSTRRVLLFVFVLTLVVGLMLGLLPALRITKTPVATGLRDQGRGIAGSAAWLRIGRLVVVGQLALSLPLLVGAGLLARTLVNLQRVDLGLCQGRPAHRTRRRTGRRLRAGPPGAGVRGPAGARPRRARRPRRHLLEQRAVRRLGQRRPDHASRATRRRATAIAARATTPSAPATSRRSASR